MFSFYLEDGSSNSYDTEECKVDPPKLFLEAMSEYDNGSEEENWDVDDELSISNSFCGRHHCERIVEVMRYMIDIGSRIEILNG